SLLIAETGEGDPLARPRVTLVGTCERLDGELATVAREAFLKKNPGASYYADYKDFSFWRLVPDSARYIGGYGRMSWVEGAEWTSAEPDPVSPSAQHAIAHMNEDHADTLVLYCKAFSRASDTTSATMVSLDRYGFEMSAMTGEGPRPIRVAFPEAVANPGEIRGAMVQLAKAARQALGEPVDPGSGDHS
ncbi:MAG: DUF2470 domain-containing protein, partial [Myxococcota bacterium]|nr:DUF2470 domain-containing protein [Myxococcota bacterium]